MGPSFAETTASRVRFAWLLGILCASAVALVPVRAAIHRRDHATAAIDARLERFVHYRRIGKCIDGRWVYANQPTAQ